MAPKIAVIGSNGFLGKPTIAALTSDEFSSKIDLPIIAITRSAKDKVSTDKIKYVEADYSESNLDKLYEIFEGIDVVIELVGANPELFAVTEKIVAHTKPKLFIPSQFGTDIEDSSKYLPGFLGLKTVHSENARKAGVKTVDIITSLFAVPGSFSYEIVGTLGVDAEAKTVTYRGDPDYKIAFSKLEDIGKSVAAVATFSDFSKLPNKVRVYSDLASNREVAERYESTHNVKLQELPAISKADSLKEGQDKLAKGFNPAEFLFYLNVLASQGEDAGLAFSSSERELINPGESLWKWGKF
ncbi:hypothetical protein CLIB1423_01S06986 [[Candida] railenensis]|uniref:NmrA-like domain-containing protein n=1 Tax=[Candida] railenensis TaxID=45579 RepID=A0A9P0QKH3_9ASCO|nr:hypothetical protein CLIB1423_01S06986 [[Candida] railenensis]